MKKEKKRNENIEEKREWWKIWEKFYEWNSVLKN